MVDSRVKVSDEIRDIMIDFNDVTYVIKTIVVLMIDEELLTENKSAEIKQSELNCKISNNGVA